MSYKRPDTGNSMNDYFSSLMDFNRLAPKILQAKTEQEFDAWLDKLVQIDRRSTAIYIKEYMDGIRPEFMKRVPIRLGRTWERMIGHRQA